MDKNLKATNEQEIGPNKEENCFIGDELDGEEDFEFVNTGGQNKDDDEFDEIVGALQDLVLDPEFEEQQRDFLERNCSVFDDDEENKIEYMQIFQDYQDKLETYLEKKLQEAKPDLDMAKFMGMMETRIDEIDPQLQDMLLTFTDFQLFKEHMLAHKKLTLSIKKKSKKFEEFKQEKQEKQQLTSLEQDLGDLVISGQGKAFYTDKNKTTKKEPVASKGVTVNKENKTKEAPKKVEKEPEAEDGAKFTHKKTSTKANPEYKAAPKGNIFS